MYHVNFGSLKYKHKFIMRSTFIIYIKVFSIRLIKQMGSSK